MSEHNGNENNASSNTEEDKLKTILESDSTTIDDFVKGVKSGLFDEDYVYAFEDISHRFADRIAPKDNAEERDQLLELQRKAAIAGDIDEMKRLTDELVKLSISSKNSSSNVMIKLEGVPESEIVQALGPLFKKVVDDVLVSYLKSHHNYALKPRRGAAKAQKQASDNEVIHFTYEKQDYSYTTGKGPLGKEVTPIAEAHAERTGNPDDKKKAKFTEDLKAGKVKGAKYIQKNDTSAESDE